MNEAIRGRVEGKCTEHRLKVLENVGIVGSVWKRVKVCEGWGIKLLRLGSNISAWIMLAKME